jgi:hypothetical protein
MNMHIQDLSKAKIILFSCLLTLLLSRLLFSDEAWLKLAGGGVAFIDGEEPDINMESEVVIIELGVGSYTVEATFNFFNYGKTKTIPVGFPCFGYENREVTQTASLGDRLCQTSRLGYDRFS